MQEHPVLTLFKATHAWFASQEQRERETASYRRQKKNRLSKLRNAFFAASHFFCRGMELPERRCFNILTSRLLQYTPGSMWRGEFRCYPEPYLDNQDMAVTFTDNMVRSNPEWFQVTRAFARFLRKIGFTVEVRSRMAPFFGTYATVFHVTLPTTIKAQRTRQISASSS